MYHKYTGVILKKYPLGEADELLTIYTKEIGKMRVKAKGSRKIQSRLAGNLLSLNEIDFEIAGRLNRKNQERISDALPILISARARTINNYLRNNLKKFAYALIGIETLYRLTPDRQENAEAYQALVWFLKEVGEAKDEKLPVRRFQLNLLKSSGFNLPIERCLNCQKKLTNEENRFYPPSQKTTAVKPWMNVDGGPSESAKAEKEGASADSAEEMKDTAGASPWRLYFISEKGGFFCSNCISGRNTLSSLASPAISLTKEIFQELSSLHTAEQLFDLNPQTELIIDGFLNYVLEREIKSNRFLQTLNQEI